MIEGILTQKEIEEAKKGNCNVCGPLEDCNCIVSYKEFAELYLENLRLKTELFAEEELIEADEICGPTLVKRIKEIRDFYAGK